MPSIRHCLPLLALLSFAPLAQAAVFTVGSGAGCTHATLPAAAAATLANGPGHDEIRLVVGQIPAITTPLAIGDQSIALRGGYASCGAAEPTQSWTTLDFPASDALRFQPSGTTTTHDLTIERIRIIMPADTGQILRVTGRANVTLRDTFFSRGSAGLGGNVFVSGSQAQLTLDRGTRIYSGSAGLGGGIFCSLGAFVAVLGDVTIDENTASGNGGGIYLDDCGLGGGSLYGPFVVDGNRTETGHGGGVFAVNGATVTLFGTGPEQIRISGNRAPVGRGGGVDASGTGTYIGIDNASITGNLSRFGGGINAASGAEVILRAQSCNQTATRPCLLIAQNTAGGGAGITNTGGALRITGGAQLEVRRGMIRNNSAQHDGSVLFATDAGSAVLMENTIILGNTGSLNGKFVALDNGASATLAHVTAHGQDIGCCKHLFGRGPATTLNVYSSVIHEARNFAPAGAGSSTNLDCVVFSGLADVPAGEFVTAVPDPARLFRRRHGLDLLPRPRAPLIDYCDTTMYASPPIDFHGWPRPHDVPNVSHGVPGGNHDLGAIEASWIFAGDFQAD